MEVRTNSSLKFCRKILTKVLDILWKDKMICWPLTSRLRTYMGSGQHRLGFLDTKENKFIFFLVFSIIIIFCFYFYLFFTNIIIRLTFINHKDKELKIICFKDKFTYVFTHCSCIIEIETEINCTSILLR